MARAADGSGTVVPREWHDQLTGASFPPMLFAFSFGVIPFCLFAFLSGARKHDIILFAPAYVHAHAHWSVRIYIIRSDVDYCSRKCERLLKS